MVLGSSPPPSTTSCGFPQGVHRRRGLASPSSARALPSLHPRPSDLADDDPIVGLPPADLKDLPGEIPTGRKPKIGIISLCDHSVDAICSASVANKQAYADRHGYDVIVDGEIIDDSSARRKLVQAPGDA